MEPNWGYLVLRTAVFSIVLFLLYLSQRSWFVRAWRVIGRVGRPWLRRFLRAAWAGVLALLLLGLFGALAEARIQTSLRAWGVTALVGLWLVSAFFSFLAVQVVAGMGWLWSRVRSRERRSLRTASEASGLTATHPAARAGNIDLPDPSRRYFFQAASYLAGAVPFVGALYGFSAERLRYQLECVEVPILGLPAALDGLRIVQLSDIHIGGYMPREQVRRAVEMANELSAELAVVTGDFITGPTDPLEACVAELARLRAPLGAWGCNGNHEIYADAEDYAAECFRRAGMRLLRQQRAEVTWHGQAFNLIGVDYQRERSPGGRRLPKLVGAERLVRRDVPNLLLSHNPNSFPRAAELGIELTLAGHTHGGQVQVEILERKWSPARFFTAYVAGLYRRPLGAPSAEVLTGGETSSEADEESQVAGHESRPGSFIYVNRGLGTIGAPVRIGVPPEITLLVLRRA